MRSTSPGLEPVAVRSSAPRRASVSPSGAAAELHHQQRPEHLGRAVHELGQVGAGIDQPVHQREDARRPPRPTTSAQDLGVELVADQPEHLAHPLRR